MDGTAGIKAVLLDIDGTLVDSNDFHVSAWEQAFRESGHLVDQSAIRRQIGKGGDMLIPALLPNSDADLRERVAARHDELFQSLYLPHVKVFPGATDLISRLHGQGIEVLLASSAKRKEVEHYVTLLGAETLLAGTTSANDVERSKPSGDIFAAALEKIVPIQASETIVIGDTPYDVIAAQACGIRAIALRSGGFPDSDLTSAGAIAIYDSVAALSRAGTCLMNVAAAAPTMNSPTKP